jgi:transcriptional regulator with XRE-family HTH domain
MARLKLISQGLTAKRSQIFSWRIIRMNQIQRLQQGITKAYPDVSTNLEPPLHPGGIWSLDIDLRGKQLAVEWSEKTGFGISNVDFETYGEGADESFDSFRDAKRRVWELLSSDQGTVPPLPVLLARLRARRGVTQKELAARLEVSQASVSGIERRGDIQLRTLLRCVEALEGAVEIHAVFSDVRYRIDKTLTPTRTAANDTDGPRCRVRPFAHQDFESLDRAGLALANRFAANIAGIHAVIEMV